MADPGFSEGGAPTPKLGALTCYFAATFKVFDISNTPKKIGENINFQTTLLVDTMNIGKTGADPGFPVGRGADPPRDANVVDPVLPR